jgi:hypothetical protein
MKKVAHATEESGTFVGGVASHLKHSLGGRMFGQTGETDAARFQMNEAVTIDINDQTDTPEQLHWHGQFLPTDVDGAAEEGTELLAFLKA